MSNPVHFKAMDSSFALTISSAGVGDDSEG